MKTSKVLLLTVVLNLIFVFFLSASAEEVPVCTNLADQRYPAVSGNIVVWMDGRNGTGGNDNLDIYMKDLLTGVESPVCTAPGEQWVPSIDGRKIAWEDHRDYPTDFSDVYMKDVDTGVESAVCNAQNAQQFPAISGDWIAWYDKRSWSDVYAKNLVTGEERLLGSMASNPAYPRISSGIATWDYFSSGSCVDIYCFDFSTGLTSPLVTGSACQQHSDVDGNIVVWMDDRNTLPGSPEPDQDIYMKELISGLIVPVCVEPGSDQMFPRISNNTVVWMDDRNGNWDIYKKDLVSGLVEPVCVDLARQEIPDISGSSIVWADYRNGQRDIYMYFEPPIQTGVSPTSGTAGTTVDATISGTGFQPGSTVKLTRSGYSDINGTGTAFVSSTSLMTSFDLTGATTGTWNVIVINPDGGVCTEPVVFNVDAVTPTRIETNYAQWPRSQRDVSWDDYGHASYSGGVSMASKWTNDALTFTFTGSKLDVIGLKASNRGIADVYIDNVLVGQIDGYAPTLQFQVPIFTQTYASDQTHTLRIVVTGTHGASSSDNWIDVDAFDVTQGGVIKRYETCNGRWLGTFTGYRDSRYSYGSTMGAKDNSAACTFTFTGSRVDWITLKTFNRGIAQVYIDNVLDATVDCYSPTFDFQTLVYSKDFGSSGTHTIKIVITGTKNPLATDYWVDVDAFDVYP